MPLHYLDTSALAKRYLPERGSDWVRSLALAETIAVSELVLVEMASSLSRRAQEGSISSEMAEANFERSLLDMMEYTVLGADRFLLMEASTLLRRRPSGIRLRSLDGIQIATARLAFDVARSRHEQIGFFVSADRMLNEAARWTGLSTENPEDHP